MVSLRREFIDFFPTSGIRARLVTLVFSCVDQMEESSSSNNTMIKLMTTNYSIWKSRMEDLFCCLDYEDTLLGDEGQPKEMADKDWTKLNRKAIGKIRQWIDNSVHQHVANERPMPVWYGKLCKSCTKRRMHRTKLFFSVS